MPKLTETFAGKAPLSSAGTQKHWDTEIRGFVLFVGKRSKTWYFQKDVGGRTKRVLIGRHPVISAASARQTALGLALEMGRGAGKAYQIGAPRLEEAMEAYLARPKLRSDTHKDGVRSQFQLHLADWLRLPLDEITKAMVVERHRSLKETPSAANHALRAFRAVWNHARRIHDLPDAPTQAIEWFAERPNGAVIEDLGAWRAAVDALENPIHTAFYRLALFTGFRKTEVFTLKWSQIGDDRIHLPMTKNGRPFDLPIGEVHHAILEPLRRLGPKWVFPARRSLSGHLSNPAAIPWTPHAHRRTFATVAMEAGVLEEVVGRLLNHTPISITGSRYMKPSLDALRPHMEQICAALQERTGLYVDDEAQLTAIGAG